MKGQAPRAWTGAPDPFGLSCVPTGMQFGSLPYRPTQTLNLDTGRGGTRAAGIRHVTSHSTDCRHAGGRYPLRVSDALTAEG